MSESGKKNDFDLLAAAHLGMTVGLTVLLVGGVGYLLDRWFTTSPWFMLLGSLTGAAMGMYYVVRAVGQMQVDSKDPRKDRDQDQDQDQDKDTDDESP